jgi:hypothetical protein
VSIKAMVVLKLESGTVTSSPVLGTLPAMVPGYAR